MDERGTMNIPHLDGEVAWARARPAAFQTPIPAVGDEVLYRHDPWGPVTLASVTEVQSLNDTADPNLWAVQRGPDGAPLIVEGRYLLGQSVDPWPMLTLETTIRGHRSQVATRESRLRGSPGWLPLDWEVRSRPTPQVDVIGNR